MMLNRHITGAIVSAGGGTGRRHSRAGAGASTRGGVPDAGGRQEAAGAEADAGRLRAGPDRAAAFGVIHSSGDRERMIVFKTLAAR